MIQGSGAMSLRNGKSGRTKSKKMFLILLLIVVLSVTACGDKKNPDDNADPNAPDRDNTPTVLATKASGKKVFSKSKCEIDYSNTKKGYVMARYTGSNNKVKFQLVSGKNTYNYDLSTEGKWEAFPLSSGDGEYTVSINENISNENYYPVVKDSFSVKLDNEFEPYLHPNQYVNYTKKTKAVSLSQEICSGAKTDLGAVEKIYDYCVENIKYDYDKADSVKPGYLPDIDETLKTQKGICFDYASVMSAMLRVQRIPSKLVIGYAGSAYHAWISVYTKETGWIDNIIEFDGKDWKRLDPTFAASGDDSDPNQVGDGENYHANYYY